MSTPTKKKSPAKPSEPKPRYNIGQKAFTITYHKGKPEELLEVKVETRSTREYDEKEASGKKIGEIVSYSYACFDHTFAFHMIPEESLYPSFQSAANKFAEAFTHLLK
jgi:hypothetical protein